MSFVYKESDKKKKESKLLKCSRRLDTSSAWQPINQRTCYRGLNPLKFCDLMVDLKSYSSNFVI